MAHTTIISVVHATSLANYFFFLFLERVFSPEKTLSSSPQCFSPLFSLLGENSPLSLLRWGCPNESPKYA